MVVRDIAIWPVLITAGVFAATLSSALGSMMGAPRILQAFARDEVFESLKFFAAGSGVTSRAAASDGADLCDRPGLHRFGRSERDRSDHHHVLHDHLRAAEPGDVLRSDHQEPELSTDLPLLPLVDVAVRGRSAASV